MSSPGRKETNEPLGGYIPWHKQPLKTIYVTSQLIVLLGVYVPYWIVKFSIRSQRPSPKWSLLKSLSVFLLRNLLGIFFNAGVIQSKSDTSELLSGKKLKLVAGSECRAIWIDPVLEGDVWGEVKHWKELNGVTLKKVGAYLWGEDAESPSVRPAKKDEKIIVHFHGGGYVVSS